MLMDRLAGLAGHEMAMFGILVEPTLFVEDRVFQAMARHITSLKGRTSSGG